MLSFTIELRCHKLKNQKFLEKNDKLPGATLLGQLLSSAKQLPSFGGGKASELHYHNVTVINIPRLATFFPLFSSDPQYQSGKRHWEWQFV